MNKIKKKYLIGTGAEIASGENPYLSEENNYFIDLFPQKKQLTIL